jgi:ubiquinone/menaquinone biosynthesis C-methylase UbiE
MDEYSSKYGRNSSLVSRKNAYKRRIGLIYNYINKNIMNVNCRLIDIGSSSGDYSEDLDKVGVQAICVDFNNEELRTCFTKIGGNVIRADARAIPFADNSFDVALIANSFRYFDKPDAVINEINRILKKNGFVILIEHNRNCPDSHIISKDVHRYYSADELIYLLRGSQFQILEIKYLLVMPPIRNEMIVNGLEKALELFDSLPNWIYPEFVILAQAEKIQ